MWSALAIYDLVQTIIITSALFLTLPIASYVYFKLLFRKPYVKNYTFKLIVLNGSADLLSILIDLIVNQLTSFTFMYNFYTFVQNNDLVNVMQAVNGMINGIGFHTALFVALNRLKTVISWKLKGVRDDSNFFYISFALSIIFSLPRVVDIGIVSSKSYFEFETGHGPALIPSTEVGSEVFRTLSNAQTVVVSCATVVVNISCAIILFRRHKLFSKNDARKFRAERGLLITSLVSYAFYTIYIINNFMARYLDIWVCAFSQFFFFGLASLTPFWCLMIFAPSIRRTVFNREEEFTITRIHSLA